MVMAGMLSDSYFTETLFVCSPRFLDHPGFRLHAGGVREVSEGVFFGAGTYEVPAGAKISTRHRKHKHDDAHARCVIDLNWGFYWEADPALSTFLSP